MPLTWDKQRLQSYLDEKIEEGLSLEYKAANALDKADDTKRKEISKDVSAMANSAGGIIIYGISEFRDEKWKHLPEKLSPIIRKDYSREWLEQMINNIKPKIDGLTIHPVSLTDDEVAYVVEIPQSTTAHQAS